MINNIEDENSFWIVKKLSREISNRDEIIKELNIKESTFYKYLELLKKTDFQIIRKNNLYLIKDYKNILNLMPHETSVLAYLEFLAFYMLEERWFKIFQKNVIKLLLLDSMKTQEEVDKKFNFYKSVFLNSFNKKKIGMLKKHIIQKNNIKIILNNKSKFFITPLCFEFRNNEFLLCFFDNLKKEKSAVPLQEIKTISTKDGKMPKKIKQEIIFELYGKLSKSYVLKDDERLVDIFEDKIVVANSSNDKKTLFKRLLRYDVLCKILFPKNDVVEFEKLVQKSLENITQIQDNVLED